MQWTTPSTEHLNIIELYIFDQKNFEVKLLFKTVIKLLCQLDMKSVVSTINKPRINKVVLI